MLNETIRNDENKGYFPCFIPGVLYSMAFYMWSGLTVDQDPCCFFDSEKVLKNSTGPLLAWNSRYTFDVTRHQVTFFSHSWKPGIKSKLPPRECREVATNSAGNKAWFRRRTFRVLNLIE